MSVEIPIINMNSIMKKYIISISIVLLLFAAFFLMLILTDTPMNISLIGAGVATLTMDTLPLTYYGITFCVALIVGFFTRRLFISLDTENGN